MKRFWNDLDTADLAGDLSHRIAVLPLGATEHHGPHLPPETDTLIAAGLVERAVDQLSADSPALFLPVQNIGLSTEHLAFANTKSLDWDEAIRNWLDIGAQVADSGIRKLLMITSHGGNSAAMDIAALELRHSRSMLAVTTSWEKLGNWREGAEPHDIHAGRIETSIMLALHPERVAMEKARNFASAQSQMKDRNWHLGFHSTNARIAWMSDDLNPEGAVGNAAAATAEEGEKYVDAAARGFCELIEEIGSMQPLMSDQR